MFSKGLFFGISKILPAKIAYAHCDVPCGIYDPKPAQIAAQTVLKMAQVIQNLSTQNPTVNDKNKFVRCVLTKEEYAGKCKEELLILWTDYFKTEHLKMFPNLHETFWKAAKLCSINKQEVSLGRAKELAAAVDEIADIFNKTKTSTSKK